MFFNRIKSNLKKYQTHTKSNLIIKTHKISFFFEYKNISIDLFACLYFTI